MAYRTDEKMASLEMAYSGYDCTKWNLPSLVKKRTDLTAPTSLPFLGPIQPAVGRPVETSATIPGIYPSAIQWCNSSGYYNTGTVASSAGTVTGTGTAFLTTGAIVVGAQIGFGSTDYGQISTWYPITAINSDTSLSITGSPTITSGTSYVINNNVQIDWVFLVDNAAAALTRRVQLYTLNRMNSSFAWIGFITATPPAAAGTFTMRGFEMGYDLYTTGTVAVSGTAVTGTGTAFLTSRLTAGSRIGFGSTNPAQISTWYIINTAISSDTALTLGTSAGTISAGTPYVIEDLRAYLLTTNATAADGGLNVVKGISYNVFVSLGTTLVAGVSTDNVNATYWLADASTETNTAACGLVLAPKTSWTSQYLYSLDSTGGSKIYIYNVRGALTLSSGKDYTTLVLSTGAQSISGTLSNTGNCAMATANHGPAIGVSAIYLVTTTRIYAAPVSGITSGSTSFLAYTMLENPPGASSTYALTGALACIDYLPNIDRFIITSTGAAGIRSYVTQYRNDGGQMDYIWLVDDKQIDQSTEDATAVIHPTILAVTQTPGVCGGLVYLTGMGTTAQTNIMHVMPTGIDWTYAASSGQRLIAPAHTISNINKFIRVYTLHSDMVGGSNTDNYALGIGTDPHRIWYRTSGITDNSGTWTMLADGNDLSSISGNTNTYPIQFMLEFRAITDTCVPARIYGLGLVYDDLSTIANYSFSVVQSSATSKVFAWRFKTAFGGTVPTLKVLLYDDVLGSLLLTDNTATPTLGTWTKCTDGSTYGAYNTTDLTGGNTTTYIRYTPTSLGDNINVRAVLALY